MTKSRCFNLGFWGHFAVFLTREICDIFGRPERTFARKGHARERDMREFRAVASRRPSLTLGPALRAGQQGNLILVFEPETKIGAGAKKLKDSS